MTTKIALLLALMVVGAGIAAAGPPALETHAADKLTVALPKGWKVTTTTGTATVFAAQQDPGRADAAALVVSVQFAGNTATEDALLDMVGAQVAKGLKVVRREALAGGGHVLVGDGMAGAVAVRVGAIAFATSGGAILGVLVAKPERVRRARRRRPRRAACVGSIKPAGAPAPCPARQRRPRRPRRADGRQARHAATARADARRSRRHVGRGLAARSRAT